MKRFNVRWVAENAIIASLYAVLTWISFPIAYGSVQFRLSEALLLLVILKPSWAIGITIGCLVANTTSSLGYFDIIFGTIATLIGLIPMKWIRNPFILGIFPIISNSIIIALELYFVLNIEPIWLSMLTVGAGELAVIYILGVPLYYLIQKNKALCERLQIKTKEDDENAKS